MTYMYVILTIFLNLISLVKDQVNNITKIEQYVIDYVIQLREKHSLTQGNIADIIGTKRSFIANIENRNSRAKYNLNHIDKLADHFGLSPKDFLPQKPFSKG